MGKIIYVIEEAGTGKKRLVRAANPTQGIGYVARTSYNVKRASQDELVGLVGAGAVVEDAAQAPEAA